MYNVQLLATGQRPPIYLLEILSGKIVAHSSLARIPPKKRYITLKCTPQPTTPYNLKRSYEGHVPCLVNMKHKSIVVFVVCISRLEEYLPFACDRHMPSAEC